jgi:hypothetical protein
MHLKELAIKRQEVEVKEQNSEVEKLINEDIHYVSQHDALFNSTKIDALQEQSKKIFFAYLQENSINYLELKDGNIKLSSENLKKLFALLRQNMSDKKIQPMQYQEERTILQKISRYKELKVSFTTNHNDEFQTLYLYLNNPIISIITKDKTYKTLYSCISHAKYGGNYAVIYRVNLSQLKSKSFVKTIIFDKNFSLLQEVEYFDFISECTQSQTAPSINLEELKTKSAPLIIQSINELKAVESIHQNRQIDIKIDSISNYFDKQIEKVKRLEQKLSQEDVKRMRIGEIENLKLQKEKKIEELEAKKEIQSNFEILGVVEIVH